MTDVKYWHGGRFPKDGTLTSQEQMRSGCAGDGYVYITTDRDLAATYAATLSGSWLMEVEPIGPVELDPESALDYSFRCASANVLRRYSLSRAERSQRLRTMQSIGYRTEGEKNHG